MEPLVKTPFPSPFELWEYGMILQHPNIKVSGNLKEGDAITVYRAEHFIGHGTLQELTESDVTIQLDKAAESAYSNLQGHGIPFEFEIRQRE